MSTPADDVLAAEQHGRHARATADVEVPAPGDDATPTAGEAQKHFLDALSALRASTAAVDATRLADAGPPTEDHREALRRQDAAWHEYAAARDAFYGTADS